NAIGGNPILSRSLSELSTLTDQRGDWHYPGERGTGILEDALKTHSLSDDEARFVQDEKDYLLAFLRGQEARELAAKDPRACADAVFILSRAGFTMSEQAIEDLEKGNDYPL